MRTMADQTRILHDGVYAVHESIEVVEVTQWGPLFCEGWSYFDLDNPKVRAFTATYPNWRYASAYGTGAAFLLSHPPQKFSGNRQGSGFNYGSTNLLTSCPYRLLILAEND